MVVVSARISPVRARGDELLAMATAMTVMMFPQVAVFFVGDDITEGGLLG